MKSVYDLLDYCSYIKIDWFIVKIKFDHSMAFHASPIQYILMWNNRIKEIDNECCLDLALKVCGLLCCLRKLCMYIQILFCRFISFEDCSRDDDVNVWLP